MNYYALIYSVVEDYRSRRTPFREEHLLLAQESVKRGELQLGGALGEPPDRALLIFLATDESVVTEFVRQDPYVTHGVVTRWEIQPFAAVVGAKLATE